MKNSNIIFIFLIFTHFVMSCAGGKESIYSLEEEPPFTITNSFFQKWVAGVQEGGSGVRVHLTIENISETLEMKYIYFRNKKESIQNQVAYPDNFMANFKKDAKRETIMDIDPKKEAKNIPPEAFPFVLKDNEAVLSYYHKGEEKYVKITKIEERPILAYPSTNPNGIE